MKASSQPNLASFKSRPRVPGWHSAALTADGRVAVWGFKNDGQTGVPKELTYSTSVASGTYHILAVGPVKP